MKKKIIVVIPVYNEGEIIIDVIKNIPSFVNHTIVVDDCSTDGTTEFIKNFIESEEGKSLPIILLRLETNQGVGGATIEGFKFGCSLGGDILVKIDGDNQMDIDFLPTLLAAIIRDGCDMAKGNRFYGFNGIKEMPLIRIIGNLVLTILTKIASKQWSINDPQNGYIALRASSFRKINVMRLNKRYAFENSLLVESKVTKLKVKDVSIPARYGNATSHIKMKLFIIQMLKYLRSAFIVSSD